MVPDLYAELPERRLKRPPRSEGSRRAEIGHQMRRDLGRRLRRLEVTASAISWADRQVAHHRQSLRARVKLHALIGERLQLMGIDPSLAVAQQRGAAAKTELAAIPDTDELRAVDEAIARADYSDADNSANQFRAKIEQIAVKYRDGQHQVDLTNASPAELLAFCVAVEMEAWG
jgi:hypothetical protein